LVKIFLIMHLTRKQKRQVEKLSKTKSSQEIAGILNVSEEAVINCLPRNFKKRALQNFQPGKTQEFALKTWFGENYLILILLAVLVFASYLNGLKSEFLSDDIATIRDNAEITTTKFAFAAPFIFLRGFLYFVTANIFGKIPAAFRFPNILFHIGVTWLFYFLICKTVSKRVAIFSSAVFAVHPLLSESVTWISGGYYPMYGFFVLLSLVFYSLSKKTDKLYYWSLTAFLLALFTSERTVYLPGVLVVWEICFGNIKQNWKKTIPFFGLGMIWGLFFIWGRIGYRINELQTSYYQKRTSQNPFFQIPVAISSYFELIIWPKALTLYHSEMNFSKINFAARFTITTAYFASLIYFFKKNKILFFWLAFFFITLSPFLTPLGISWVVAERYVYLGCVGIFIATGMLLEKILRKISKNSFLFYFLTALLIIPLQIRTIYRNVDWKNQDNLWLAAEKFSPSSPQNHNNLGDLYARWGQLDKAIKYFKRATELQVNYGDAFHNMANIYVQKNDFAAALFYYQKAIEFNPNIWQSYQNIGSIYFQQGRLDLAEESFKNALKINPQNPSLHYALGATYGNQKKTIEAENEFRTSLQFDPTNIQAQQALQQLLNQP